MINHCQYRNDYLRDKNKIKICKVSDYKSNSFISTQDLGLNISTSRENLIQILVVEGSGFFFKSTNIDVYYTWSTLKSTFHV